MSVVVDFKRDEEEWEDGDDDDRSNMECKSLKGYLRPCRIIKRRLYVEEEVVGIRTTTLKSELGYLGFESLQALCNGGWRLKETSSFFVECVFGHS